MAQSPPSLVCQARFEAKQVQFRDGDPVVEVLPSRHGVNRGAVHPFALPVNVLSVKFIRVIIQSRGVKVQEAQMDDRRLSFWEKTKGFIAAPVNTFNSVAPEALGSALKYFAVWLVPYIILRTVVYYTLEIRFFEWLWGRLGLSEAPLLYDFDPVIFALLAVLGAFAGLFIGGAWTHLFVRAFGGRKGYWNTIKAFAYGNTPVFLFGWLPLVGMLFSIWGLVLNIIGIRQLHEMPTGRATGAVLLSMVAAIVIAVLVAVAVVLLIAILAVA
jgi:hypothetical protein